MKPEREAWIKRWCAGWRESIDGDYPTMPLGVALDFVDELFAEIERIRNEPRYEAAP